MNQKAITPADRILLFQLIAYGRATPANMARALDVDRRTAQRMTTPEALADIIPPVDSLDIAAWYALLDPDWHSWTTEDGIWHHEAGSAHDVRADLAFLVKEIVGEALKNRMVEECPSICGIGNYSPKGELRQQLDLDFSIPEGVMRHYHYKPALEFFDPDGNPL